MKLLLLTVLVTCTLSAQSTKLNPSKKEETQTLPSERNLEEKEALKFKLAVANVLLLRKTFDIDKYETELKPFNDEQNSIIVAACKSVGVDQAGIQKGECGFNAGVGPDGKILLGADGKPVQPRVWKNIPPLPPVQNTEKK